MCDSEAVKAKREAFALMGKEAADVAGCLRRHENTGRLLSERPFLERLSKQLVRNLVAGKGGRPEKGPN